jgi:hypothetical protein
MLRAQLGPKSIESQSISQQQVAAIQSRQGEPWRAKATREKSAGRAESFLAILLAAFSMSPA